MKFYYFLSGLLNPILLGWMRFKTRFQPRERVRIAVFNDKNEVLLVRPVIGIRKWELPGGMPARGESVEAAAARELREETGIRTKASDMVFVIEYLRPYPMYIYEVRIHSGPIRKNVFEIRDARWFSLSELPLDTVPFIRRLLKER